MKYLNEFYEELKEEVRKFNTIQKELAKEEQMVKDELITFYSEHKTLIN